LRSCKALSAAKDPQSAPCTGRSDFHQMHPVSAPESRFRRPVARRKKLALMAVAAMMAGTRRTDGSRRRRC